MLVIEPRQTDMQRVCSAIKLFRQAETNKANVTDLMFIAEIWAKELFSFHNKLPGYETFQRREDRGRKKKYLQMQISSFSQKNWKESIANVCFKINTHTFVQ